MLTGVGAAASAVSSTGEAEDADWSLYDYPALYDRVFGYRNFNEEARGPVLVMVGCTSCIVLRIFGQHSRATEFCRGPAGAVPARRAQQAVRPAGAHVLGGWVRPLAPHSEGRDAVELSVGRQQAGTHALPGVPRCGPGRHSIELAGRGAEAYALDNHAGMLAYARELAAAAGARVTFLKADMTDFSLPVRCHLAALACRARQPPRSPGSCCLTQITPWARAQRLALSAILRASKRL